MPDDGAAPLCVAFANTLRPGTDDLGSPNVMAAWLRSRGDGDVGEGVLLRVSDFRTLRDTVRSALSAATDRAAVRGTDADTLNAASAAAPTWPVLRVDGTGPAVRATDSSDTSETTQMLAAIARSAIELLGGQDAARLRECSACGTFFLSSRSGRIWCSASCGNRTRVARHRARRAASAEA